MSNRDDLLLGAEPVPVADSDSDGDGVSDAQERLDGTDAHDASSSIRHDTPTLDQSHDPRGDITGVSLEHNTLVDVEANTPKGVSVDQALPTGLDGKPIDTKADHYGIGDNKLIDGHGGPDVANVQRDPTIPGASTETHGRDPFIETNGRAPGPGAGTHTVVHTTPPPGEAQTGSADPDHNRQLVADDDLRALIGVAPAGSSGKAKEDPAEKFKRESATPSEKAAADAKAWAEKNKGKMTDPDAGTSGGGGTPTQEEVDRAVIVHHGATDVIQGFGGTQVEGNAPPKRPVDFVRDPIEKESKVNVAPATAPADAGLEISHTINPNDGIDQGRAPSSGPHTGTGVGNTGGEYGHSSDAATAAVASPDTDTAHGITNIGGGTTGSGIHSVAPDGGGADSGRASESHAMMANGPGTQTEDEVYIGKTSAPAQDSDGDGVSDAQERSDGTDPHDASSSIRHDTPTLNQSQDPRGDGTGVTLEHNTLVDVTGMAPKGVSIDQALPTGLDGKPVETTNHYGIGDNPLLTGHGGPDVADVGRDPTIQGASTETHGRDPFIETNGRAPGPMVTHQTVVQSTPPPGEVQTGSADPDHNMALVSEDAPDGGTKPPKVDPHHEQTAEEKVKARDSNAANRAADEWAKKNAAPKMSDPDAGPADGGKPTQEEVDRAVVVHHGATDVVQGFGGTQVEGDAPPKQAIDLVRDPIEKASSVNVAPATAPAPAGQEISHTINPNDGIDPSRGPSSGPHTGTAGGDNTGAYGHSADAATAAVASPDSDAPHGITNIGDAGAGAGIHSVDVSGIDSASDGPADDADDAGAAPAIATHDIMGMPAQGAAPPDAVSDDAPVDVDLGAALPDADLQPIDMPVDSLDVPIDPVADAIGGGDAPVDNGAPDNSFAGLDMPDDLAVPDEVDLDDGF